MSSVCYIWVMTNAKFMTVVELRSAILASYAPAEARREAAPSRPVGQPGHAQDWVTNEEMVEIHRLQMLLATHPDNTTAAARARCEAKRAARRLAAAS